MTHLRSKALTVLAAGAAILLPGQAALAQSCEAPPGTSAVEQYCEALPEGSGSESGNDFQRASRAGESQTPSASIPESSAQDLTDAGEDGRAVVALSQNTGPKSNTEAKSGVAGTSTQGSVEDAPGGPLKAVSASVENGATLGAPFGWALLGSVVVVIGLAWMRFRQRTAPGDN